MRQIVSAVTFFLLTVTLSLCGGILLDEKKNKNNEISKNLDEKKQRPLARRDVRKQLKREDNSLEQAMERARVYFQEKLDTATKALEKARENYTREDRLD